MPERVLLLTGFGAFPGVTDNPTARVAQSLHGLPLAGWRVQGAVLPVAWERARAEVAGLVAAHAPACIVHLGVATEATAVRIENQGANHLQFRIADVDGAQPQAGEIVPLAPATLTTPVAVARLVAHLQPLGVTVELSENAGRYVCNATYFTSLHAYPERRVLFVHLPPVSAAWPLTRLTDAIARILEFLSV